MKDPLKSLGMWRAKEGALEVMVPLTASLGAWYVAYRFFSEPAVGRPLTSFELTGALGLAVGLTAWSAGRQIYMLGRRHPWNLLLIAFIYMLIGLLVLPSLVRNGFATKCTEGLGGLIVDAQVFGETGETYSVCQVGGIPNNPYLPGIIYRPSWNGKVSPFHWGFLLCLSTLAVVGFRDRKLGYTRMGANLINGLRFSGALGSDTAFGAPKPKAGKIQACCNATLWGEICGQIYAAEKVFAPGEWCGRCQQTFRKTEREITFKVVTLFTGDVDVLNGLERMDINSWNRGEAMTPDARISGMERWVMLGTITVPDTISVSQLLALTHTMIPQWGGSTDLRVKAAVEVATRRASRISAWIWTGQLAARLTYARPMLKAVLAIGPTRLRDIVSDGGEEVWLQLDIGLFPIEIRASFKKTFADVSRPPDMQCSNSCLWIPVGPAGKDHLGMWVPRVEGEALRAWLSTERLREEDEKGTIPLPYLPFDPYHRENSNVVPPNPRPGSLDLVRMSLDKNEVEPTMVRVVGASIAEWDWLEWEQIQLLRQQVLVLVEANGGSS